MNDLEARCLAEQLDEEEEKQAEEIINEVPKSQTEVTLDEVAQTTFKVHESAIKLHFRALACHCECLSMNAENTWRVCCSQPPPYLEAHYQHVMLKWGLIDEKGEPLL